MTFLFAVFMLFAQQTTTAPAKPASPVMIARIWRGRVPTARAEEYTKYLYDNGIVKIRAITGNLGAEMLKRTDGDVTEFVVISYWPSRDAIRAFAGDDIEKAHFLPRDREFLIHPDEYVRHYEVSASEWAAARP
jgi:heme-degrading monooxygenase HmoA